MDRVTFASASGIALVALIIHFAAGLASIVAGAIALAAPKGGRLHKQSGMVFCWGMVGLGLTAAGIGAYERVAGQVVAGLVAAYLVFSGMTTVKPVPGLGRRFHPVLMCFAFTLAVLLVVGGVTEWIDSSVQVVGRPRVGPPLVMGSIMMLAAIGDLRSIRAGGLTGSRRLARHLWRMCFGLFIATGSFFLGQMTFVPEPVRIVPLLFVLALAPIPFLFYWMWRVRFRGRMHGMIVAR